MKPGNVATVFVIPIIVPTNMSISVVVKDLRFEDKDKDKDFKGSINE